MIRFCTEAGTKQPENGPLLLYWSRQQMEADRQVSRSYRIGNAIVTRASRRKESKKKGGASNFWSPLDCTLLPSGARWLCQLFKKSNSCWKREHFSWFCFPRHDPRAVREEPGRQRGWTRKAKARHLWGLGHRSAHPSRHLRTVSFFNLPHPVPPILPRAGGRACSERRAPAPPCEGETHLLAWPPQAVRQARRGRGGRTGYAGDGAPRGAALGETRRAVAGVQSARCPRPRA